MLSYFRLCYLLAMFNNNSRWCFKIGFHCFAINQINIDGNTLEMYLNDHYSNSNSDEDDVVGTQRRVDGVITTLSRNWILKKFNDQIRVTRVNQATIQILVLITLVL